MATTAAVSAPSAPAIRSRAALPAFESLQDVLDQAAAMRTWFERGETLDPAFRIAALRRLKSQLKANENRVLGALHADLGKDPFEGYESELALVYDEINTCVARLGTWSKPKRVPTPFYHFPSSSMIYPQPYGVALVLSPWNYPLQLALVPLVDAIAAGNCVALKPSRTSAHTGTLLCELLGEIFDPNFVCGFPGSANMNDWLLKPHFDFVFFTGSARVGKEIMGAAAEHLTPVVLELGGKSPCFVDRSANLKVTAERIAWGKGLNSGQTCVTPDHLLVHADVADELVKLLEGTFKRYYGDALTCPWWPHMISDHHWQRVMGLIHDRPEGTRIAFGGHGDEASLKIEPTCVTGVTLDDPLMGQEIFGPVLPVITWTSLDEVLAMEKAQPHPLACYVFAEDREVPRRIIRELPYGGGCVNDCVTHIANNALGFGGLGNSGLGEYHGKHGFDTFTHYKSVLTKGTWCEIPIRNPPFDDKFWLLKALMPH